jgi:hypothetical protein
MARQKARIATLEIRGLPDGALVRMDGREIGKAPIGAVVRVGVGKHAIAATAEGYESATNEIIVAGEDHKVVNLVLAKSAAAVTASPLVVPVVPAAAPPVVSDIPPASAAKPGMSKLRIAGIVIGAVGVAGLATGTACWFVGKGRKDDAMNVYKEDYPRAQRLHSQAQDYVTAANVGFIAGGALAALGVGAFIVGTPAKPASTSGMQAYLLPSLTPRGAGIGAGGTW